ncbi:MAG: Holliday junction branch migration protein RuvA [Alphaproteobacteria bacterium]|nr:Holliday junction branch migration protein RuvA [Alphaproteobacteria bacterium]
MIAKLHGIIDTISEDWCIIDVNGVGYMVFASSRTLGRLSVGAEVSLQTIMNVREDDISLYGFADAWEKEWFNTLTKVQGVGAKVCLSILSALSPSQLAQAVNAQDKASFCRANGVGPKLAARIVTELKDKIVTIPVTSNKKDVLAQDGDSVSAVEPAQISVPDETDYSKTEDVISALLNLGYQRIEAYHVASKVVSANPDADIAGLIRLALKEFANKDM